MKKDFFEYFFLSTVYAVLLKLVWDFLSFETMVYVAIIGITINLYRVSDKNNE